MWLSVHFLRTDLRQMILIRLMPILTSDSKLKQDVEVRESDESNCYAVRLTAAKLEITKNRNSKQKMKKEAPEKLLYARSH